MGNIGYHTTHSQTLRKLLSAQGKGIFTRVSRDTLESSAPARPQGAGNGHQRPKGGALGAGGSQAPVGPVEANHGPARPDDSPTGRAGRKRGAAPEITHWVPSWAVRADGMTTACGIGPESEPLCTLVWQDVTCGACRWAAAQRKKRLRDVKRRLNRGRKP